MDTDDVPTFECPVCTDSWPVEGSFTGSCDHRTCMECMGTYVHGKLDDGAIGGSELVCVACPQPLEAAQVYHILDASGRGELKAKYDELTLARTFPQAEPSARVPGAS